MRQDSGSTSRRGPGTQDLLAADAGPDPSRLASTYLTGLNADCAAIGDSGHRPRIREKGSRTAVSVVSLAASGSGRLGVRCQLATCLGPLGPEYWTTSAAPPRIYRAFVHGDQCCNREPSRCECDNAAHLRA